MNQWYEKCQMYKNWHEKASVIKINPYCWEHDPTKEQRMVYIQHVSLDGKYKSGKKLLSYGNNWQKLMEKENFKEMKESKNHVLLIFYISARH